MDSRRVRKLAQCLVAVINGAEDSLGNPIGRNSKSNSYGLRGETEEKLELLIRELLQECGWSVKFSEEFLRSELLKIVRLGIKTTDDAVIRLAFSSLVDRYESFDSIHKVTIPLAGVRLSLPEFRLGTITLTDFDDAKIGQHKSRAEHLVRAAARDSVESEVISVSNEIEKLNGEVCAEYELVAEPIRARERAHEDLNTVLDVLRFVSSLHVPAGFKIRLGRKGEVTREIRNEMVVTHDNYLFSGELIGPIAPYAINESSITLLIQSG